jgi:hypothetical protein
MNLFQKGDGLLIIDVQKDFCPGGALPIEEGGKIIPVLNDWIKQARRADLPVYASRDCHPDGHISFKTQGGPWPPHCIQDSDGAEFHPALRLPDDVVKITNPLVAVVACGFMMVGMSVIDSTDGEARIFQGIVTGIGFIGGGAIFKDKDRVSGTASAASIWNTGAIGLAVAFNRFEIAIILSLLNFVTLLIFGRFKKKLSEND